MKLAGFFLLLAGWVLVVIAIVILPSVATRYIFVIAGLSVEVFGLVLTARHHNQFGQDHE